MSLDANRYLERRVAGGGVESSHVELVRRVAALERRLGPAAAAIAAGDPGALGARVDALELRVDALEELAHRELAGVITAAGAAQIGAEYSVNKTGTGVYVITFDDAFSAAPAIALGGFAVGGTRLAAASATGFEARTRDAAGGAVDAAFHFTATAV